MLRYLTRRFVSGLIAFLAFTAVLFFSFNLLIPGDYVTTLSLILPGNEARDALRAELGLDQPLWRQYFLWLGHLAQGNLGNEFSNFGQRATPVSELLKVALPSTILVFVSGALVAFFLGQWLGKIISWRAPRWLSGAISLGSIGFYTAFPPWLSFLLGFAAIARLNISPRLITSNGFRSRFWREAPIPSWMVMRSMIFSILAMLVILILLRWLVTRLWRRRLHPLFLVILFCAGVYALWATADILPYAVNILQIAAIPFLTFVLLGFGDTVLLMQVSMIDTRHEQYVQLARAKGLPERLVRNRHAARNAMLPVLSRFIINLPYLLTAVVIVEKATGWPGVGDLLFTAIDDQNTFVYLAIIVIVGLLSLFARLTLDVAYVVLDPRLRYGDARYSE